MMFNQGISGIGFFSDIAREYRMRVDSLILDRGMTPRAAKIVVDAAMYGIGCTEGTVRADIEANKKKPTS